MIEKKIYLGPTIPGIARSGAIFTAGLPERLQTFQTNNPAVKSLIVPVSDLLEAKKALETEGSIERTTFNKLSKLKGDLNDVEL